MLVALLILLIILWLLGYLPVGLIPIPNLILFSFNGQNVTLWNLITLLIILWIIGLLPRPFREIASILLIIWILSFFGIFFFTSLSPFIVLLIILGLIVYLFVGL